MNKKMIAGLIVLLAVLILGFFIIKTTLTANAIKEENTKTEWLSENCNCTERNNLKCPEGFILEPDARVCRNETKITNVLLGCSKYDCNGEIYLLVNGKWEKQK